MNNEIKLNVSQSRGYENAKLELIKVTTNEQGQKLVSGRELHEVLEIGTQFTKWIQRMIEYGFVEDVDYTILKEKVDSQKRLRTYEQEDYILTLDMAKHIAMVQRTEIGMKVRNYFIECEKVAHNPYANLSPELQSILMLDQKQQMLEQNQTKLNQRVTDLEENVKLEPGEYGLVSKRVSKRVYEVQKERQMNLNKKQIGELFRALNKDILEITGVKTRTQLRQKHLDMVLDFIDDWYPSKATMFNINQMSLDI